MQHLIAWFWANVWPNLVASALCFVIATGWAHRELVKLHRRHEAHAQQLAALHGKVDQLLDQRDAS